MAFLIHFLHFVFLNLFLNLFSFRQHPGTLSRCFCFFFYFTFQESKATKYPKAPEDSRKFSQKPRINQSPLYTAQTPASALKSDQGRITPSNPDLSAMIEMLAWWRHYRNWNKGTSRTKWRSPSEDDREKKNIFQFTDLLCYVCSRASAFSCARELTCSSIFSYTQEQLNS